MAFPRILLALPLLAAGAFLPPLGPEPAKAPDGAVGMEHETFAVEEVTVHRGQSLLFVNDSRYMHIIGPGVDGTLAEEEGGPMRERVLMPTDDRYTLGPFNTLGTFNITCSMHPEMTVKVVVTE
jgi:plastocyanin